IRPATIRPIPIRTETLRISGISEPRPAFRFSPGASAIWLISPNPLSPAGGRRGVATAKHLRSDSLPARTFASAASCRSPEHSPQRYPGRRRHSPMKLVALLWPALLGYGVSLAASGPVIFPAPRQMELRADRLVLAESVPILLPGQPSAEDLFLARFLTT